MSEGLETASATPGSFATPEAFFFEADLNATSETSEICLSLNLALPLSTSFLVGGWINLSCFHTRPCSIALEGKATDANTLCISQKSQSGGISGSSILSGASPSRSYPPDGMALRGK